MAIIVSENGKGARRVSKSSFEQEDYLQQYIYNNPDAIPVYEIDEDIRLLVLAREFPTDSGPIDALGVDQNGNIYLIETKLYKNPDKRTVVAQVLDYGASLWTSSIDFTDFTSQLEKHVQKQFDKSLHEQLQEFFSIDQEATDTLLDSIQNNLNNGIFKFVVLMDSLHRQLKDLILFINRNSQFDVYAVELEYYKHDTYEIMIPKIYGTEVKKDMGSTKKSGGRRKWDEQSYWQEVEQNLPPSQVAALRKLYDWSLKHADIVRWGSGTKRGSFNPTFNEISPNAFISVYTDGSITVSYAWMPDKAERKRLHDTLKKYINVEGVTDVEDAELKVFGNIPAEYVEKNAEKIVEAVSEFVI